MTDETRDALLLALAELAIAGRRTEAGWRVTVQRILARARHEIERPEDRG